MSIVEHILNFFFDHVDIEKEVDGEKKLYLRRWFISSNEKGSRYLHKMLRGDEDPDPHDHPWPFKTRVLWGYYIDESYDVDSNGRKVPRWEVMSAGKTAFRPSRHLHRVKKFQGDKPTWTLVHVSPYERDWGFVKTDGDWIYWREYLDFWGPDPYDRVVKTEWYKKQFLEKRIVR